MAEAAPAFVALVPLRARATAKDWGRVSAFARAAIGSVLAGDPAARAVLVCDDVPEGLSPQDRLEVVTVRPPVPSGAAEQMQDKLLKIRAGLKAVRASAPAWVMKLDADDLVSRRLPGFVLGLTPGVHCYLDRGWRWTEGSRWLQLQTSFHRHNGSSLACYLTPADFGARDSPALAAMTMPHGQAVAYLRRCGADLATPPFPAAIYRMEHGDNHSRMFARSWRRHLAIEQKLWRLAMSRPLTKRIRAEFGLG